MAQASDSQINSVLAQLKQACDRVWAFGDMSGLRKALPTGAAREELDNDLVRIFLASRYLPDAIEQRLAADPLPVTGISPELWRFYEERFLPNADSLRSLYRESLFGEIDPSGVLDDLESASAAPVDSDVSAVPVERQVTQPSASGLASSA